MYEFIRKIPQKQDLRSSEYCKIRLYNFFFILNQYFCIKNIILYYIMHLNNIINHFIFIGRIIGGMEVL